MKKIILAFLLSATLCTCATKKSVEYIDREVVKYETKVTHDTVINDIHDSVFHTIYQKGDTIYNTKYVEKTRWMDRVVVKCDTITKDSVQVVFRETTKEKKIIPMWCYFSLWGCSVFLVFAVRKLLLWLKIC